MAGFETDDIRESILRKLVAWCALDFIESRGEFWVTIDNSMVLSLEEGRYLKRLQLQEIRDREITDARKA